MWYNPNPSKLWLVIKPTGEKKSREVFGGTRINVRTDGRKYPGIESGCGKYAEELVSSWCADQLKFPSKIAKTEPQEAYVESNIK